MNLPEVKPRQEPGSLAPAQHVLAVITGLEPGWYETGDLYPRYLAWAEQAGHPPVSSRFFGQALARVAVDARFRHGHVRVFKLEPPSPSTAS